MANFLTILHECQDFAAWHNSYLADAPRRDAAGLTELHVLREHTKPNLLALMFAVSDVERAKAMGASPGLAEAMNAAGVIGTPRVRLRQGDYTRHAANRYATMTLTVRDYATARKAYATDAADRKAADLTDLGMLQQSDDPSNLLLLWAVGDIAKASAFFESPALATHMSKNAGVVGPVERHLWSA